MTKEWSQLPNATHIDWVLETQKKNPEVWSAAWEAISKAAKDAAFDVAAWGARNAALEAAAWSAWIAKRVFARDAAWEAAGNVALVAAALWGERNAALEAALDAARDASRWAAWDAITALVAWDDSSELLDKSVKEVEALANEGNHAAVLLLPAVIVKHKLKELEND